MSTPPRSPDLTSGLPRGVRIDAHSAALAALYADSTADDIREARETLEAEFERGRLLGRLEAFVVMAAAAMAAACVWLVVGR